MEMRLFRRSLLIVLGCVSVAPAAFAQTAAPAITRLRATIETAGPGELALITRRGEKVTLKLADNLSVAWIVKTELGTIQPNAFIGVTSVPAEGGTMKALEVHVFPEAMRGTGEGHRPWDLEPGSTMTNGTVGSVKVTNGRTITVGYKGGEQTIFVPENVPVVTYQPATREALTKGAHIIAFATEGTDGSLSAARISVGKDGLVPPM
jgi:hypothetical protein